MLGYFGPEGTFTHQALLTLDLGEEARPFPSVAQALEAVRAGVVRAAVVPIENSVEGGVSATIDALATGGPLVIQREVLLPIVFGLYAKSEMPLSEVRRIVTHPHAAAQVRNWVERNLPQATVTENGSTAAGAAAVAADDSPYDAAICAEVAGKLYGLTALASGVADNPDAVTRFILVTQPGELTPVTGHDKTSLLTYIKQDHPGALMDVLSQFASRGVSMCRLESRPTKDQIGNYYFSIDAEGHVGEARLAEALMGLHRICKKVVFLGSYPRADGVEPVVHVGFRDSDYAKASRWLAEISGKGATQTPS